MSKDAHITMSRSTTAYASAYQLDRVHKTALVRGWRGTLTTNFVGALAETDLIYSATWYVSNPSVLVMSNAGGSDTLSSVKLATVDVDANYASTTALKCEITLTDNRRLNVFWDVTVLDYPSLGADYAATGPESITWTSPDLIISEDGLGYIELE